MAHIIYSATNTLIQTPISPEYLNLASHRLQQASSPVALFIATAIRPKHTHNVSPDPVGKNTGLWKPKSYSPFFFRNICENRPGEVKKSRNHVSLGVGRYQVPAVYRHSETASHFPSSQVP